VPRGKLELPADLVARSHGRDRDAPRERERGADRHRGERRTSGAAAPRQPVDELFYKPYEPANGQPASPETPKQEGRSNAPKRQLAVLLGGSRKG